MVGWWVGGWVGGVLKLRLNLFQKLPGRKQRKRYTVQLVEETNPPSVSYALPASAIEPPRHNSGGSGFSPWLIGGDSDITPLRLEIPGQDDAVMVDPRSGWGDENGVRMSAPLRMDFAGHDWTGEVTFCDIASFCCYVSASQWNI